MTDAISVIGPGWRATNSSGQIITDGILAFFDAGTSNARTVYSDSSLSTSLGTEVSCNSGGYPVTSGNVRTLIYTGNTAYKVRLTSAIVGSTVWEHDNVLGALDTSGFLTEAAVADQSLVNISANRSITTADKGKLINVNCSAGARTMTFDDAATLGDGFFVGLRHDGTANQVLVTGDGSDTFSIPGASVTGFAISGRGNGLWITCDGSNFKTHSMGEPLIFGTSGVIVIADRLSTPPGSPTPGARYIVGSSPTGDWSGFAEHDIAEADGFGNWFNYTPSADCGWHAYVQDENTFYGFFGSAWGTTVSGLTADTDPDGTNDFMEIFDASASANKKIPLYLSPGAIVAIIEDQKSQNTNGQSLTSGGDRIRELTTLAYNRNTIASLSSNQFTLPAGTWEILWQAPAATTGAGGVIHQTILYNVTDAVNVARGSNGSVETGDGGSVVSGAGLSFGSSVVTIAGSKAFEIRHRVTDNCSGGYAANQGTEIYTRVIVRRA